MTASRSPVILLGVALVAAPLATAIDAYTPLPDQQLTGPEDRFGEGVAIDGELAAVVAENGVTTFLENGDRWSRTDRLTGVGPDTLDIEDSNLVAASPQINPKRVLVYEHTGDGRWSLNQEVTSPSDQDADFSSSADLGEDMLVVGADAYTTSNGTETGAVYTYQRDTTGAWEHKQTLTPNDQPPNPAFGDTLALHNNTLVVGAPRDDTPQDNSGSAYVFTHHNGQWTQTAKLTAPDASEGDNFGDAVATNHGTIAIGAPDRAIRDSFQAGGVYLFAPSDGTWTHQQTLEPLDPNSQSLFGADLSMREHQLVVGAPGNGLADQFHGSAHMYIDGGKLWQQTARLSADHSTGLGRSVASNGHTVMAGAPFEDLGENPTVYVWDGTVATAEAGLCKSPINDHHRTQIPLLNDEAAPSLQIRPCTG